MCVNNVCKVKLVFNYVYFRYYHSLSAISIILKTEKEQN
jgi:hypothetical protein